MNEEKTQLKNINQQQNNTISQLKKSNSNLLNDKKNEIDLLNKNLNREKDKIIKLNEDLKYEKNINDRTTEYLLILESNYYNLNNKMDKLKKEIRKNEN